MIRLLVTLLTCGILASPLTLILSTSASADVLFDQIKKACKKYYLGEEPPSDKTKEFLVALAALVSPPGASRVDFVKLCKEYAPLTGREEEMIKVLKKLKKYGEDCVNYRVIETARQRTKYTWVREPPPDHSSVKRDSTSPPDYILRTREIEHPTASALSILQLNQKIPTPPDITQLLQLTGNKIEKALIKEVFKHISAWCALAR